MIVIKNKWIDCLYYILYFWGSSKIFLKKHRNHSNKWYFHSKLWLNYSGGFVLSKAWRWAAKSLNICSFLSSYIDNPNTLKRLSITTQISNGQRTYDFYCWFVLFSLILFCCLSCNIFDNFRHSFTAFMKGLMWSFSISSISIICI